MKYSFIVPVYNRPAEVEELLESLCTQTLTDFEVVIVEDGSAEDCRSVVERYADRLSVRYFYKENSGPGPSRNYGVAHAEGEYVLILDSDVVLPPTYLEEVERELTREACDAFGGPDRAHPSFTPMQKAINYAMTSFFTTGGIRGGKKKMDKFYPRSFNMGVRKTTYDALKGFSEMRFGEDIDFSTRIFEGAYRCRLFPEAWVWHKRRTDLKKFFKQVHNSGIARINLTKRHPGTLKLVHMLPAAFTAGCALLLAASLGGLSLYIFVTDHMNRAFGLSLSWLALLPLALYALLVFCDSSLKNRSVHVGLLSIAASFTQLLGYGSGFLRAWWKRCVLGQGEFEAYKRNFYK